MCAMPFHMNEPSEQNRQHYFEAVKSFRKNKCHTVIQKNWEGGWTALKEVMHLSTYYIFLQEYYFLLKGIHCLQGNYFEEVESLKKRNKKNERKAELLKGVLHLSTQSSFLARILLLIQGNILSSRQTVTCKQHWTIFSFFKECSVFQMQVSGCKVAKYFLRG